MSKPFLCTDDPSSLCDRDDLLLVVDPTLSSKRELLDWYSKHLSMPEYFGSNWDALSECLRDLSWIGNRRVILHHRKLPLMPSPGDQLIYVQILADAVQEWELEAIPRLIVTMENLTLSEVPTKEE